MYRKSQFWSWNYTKRYNYYIAFESDKVIVYKKDKETIFIETGITYDMLDKETEIKAVDYPDISVQNVGKEGVSWVATITLMNVLLFIASIFAGALIYTSIKLFFASLSFWVKISGPFLQVAYEMADFAKYPTEIYAKAIRFIITWIIPFAFVAYLPASYFLGVGGFLGMNSNAVVIGIECIIAIVFWIVAYAVFHKGTLIYESAGN
mgnify:CR=1 FL=1